MATITTLDVVQAPELLEDAQALSAALADLIRVVQFRDRDRACCFDVSVSQCYALKAIVEGGALTVNEVAAELYLDKSTASRVANGLEEKGYIQRERAAVDGRVVVLTATEAGQSLCRRIDEELAVEYADLLKDFDPEVRVAMTRLVSRLAGTFASRVETSGGNCCVVR